MKEWNFPHGKNLTPSGHNNTAIEIFLDNIINSLTRETIQNSLDAKRESSDGPVVIKFNEFSMEKEMIPDLEKIKEFALPRAYQFWEEKNNDDTIAYLNNFNNTLIQDKLRVLRISDYNTEGLNKSNYDSLVVGNAYSVKENSDSAGSKGIGKAAPFAASNLRMVFYNTVPTKDSVKSAGILNFVSFIYEEEENLITQERSFLSDNGESKIPEQITFGQPQRNEDEYGTDLFIIGLKKFENLTNRILLSSVNNFLLSIINKEIEIHVEDIILNHETLNEVLQSLQKMKLKSYERHQLFKTMSFYEVMMSEETLTFYLDETFKDFTFIENLSDAKLYLLQHEGATRTVLQTRKSGMKIYERKSISGNINFTGVFQALGKNLNILLKDMENAAHDTWSTERLQEARGKEAEAFLLKLYQWYKAKVKESYELEIEDEVDAFGVRDLLPIESKGEGGASEKDSGVSNQFDTVQIKRNQPKGNVMNGDKEEEELIKDIDLIGVKEGGSSGPGSRRRGPGGGNNPDNRHGPGDEEGDYQEDDTSDEVVAQKSRKVSIDNQMNIKVLEVDSLKGKYRIVGKPKKNINFSEIKLRSVGADGRTFSLKLRLSENKRGISARNNSIYLERLEDDHRFEVPFEIDSKIRVKMECEVYEIKK